MYVNYYNKKNKTTEDSILINFQLIGVLLLLLTGINTLFLRIAYMYTIFQVISIPIFSKEISISYISFEKMKEKLPINLEKMKKNIVLLKHKLKKWMKILKKNINNFQMKDLKKFKSINYKKVYLDSMAIKVPLVAILIVYILSFSYINIFHNVEECLPYRTFIGSETHEKK